MLQCSILGNFLPPAFCIFLSLAKMHNTGITSKHYPTHIETLIKNVNSIHYIVLPFKPGVVQAEA